MSSFSILILHTSRSDDQALAINGMAQQMRTLFPSVRPDITLKLQEICLSKTNIGQEFQHIAAGWNEEKQGISTPDLICFPAGSISTSELLAGFADDVRIVPLLAVVTGGGLSTALKAVQHGAWDFITLPAEASRLQSTMLAALRFKEQNLQNRASMDAAIKLAGKSADQAPKIALSGEQDGAATENLASLTSRSHANADLPEFCRPFWLQERAIIENTIQHFDGNISRAASVLKISPSTIYRKRQAWSERQSSGDKMVSHQ